MLELEIDATEIAVSKTKVKQGTSGADLIKGRNFKKVAPVEKEKFNAVMDKDLLDRAKNICFFSSCTLTDMVTEGLRIVVERMEAENGGPFEVRTGKLKTGRKKKVVNAPPSPQKLEPVGQQQIEDESEEQEVEVEVEDMKLS